MNFTLFVTVLLTVVVLVVTTYVIAKLMDSRLHNAVKGGPYESSVSTRGSSWPPMYISYYLFTTLFLMFDIEAVLFYPRATVMWNSGATALTSIGFFLVVLVLDPAYAWRKEALEWK